MKKSLICIAMLMLLIILNGCTMVKYPDVVTLDQERVTMGEGTTYKVPDRFVITEPAIDVPGIELPTEVVTEHIHELIIVEEIEAQCRYRGRITYQCACGYELVERPEAVGHDIEIIPGVEPTCISTGLTAGSYCKRCNETLVEQKVIESLGHDRVDDLCKVATCTEDGLTLGVHCQRCGLVLVEQEVIPALGHKNIVTDAIEPTCTTEGYTSGCHCENCGMVFVEAKAVAALGHVEVIDVAVKPSCVDSGFTEGKHCSRCGKTLIKQQYVPATNHSNVTYDIPDNYPATCNNTGRAGVAKCLDCGKIIYSGAYTTDALGHDYSIYVAGKAATCTEDGYNATYKCSRCGKLRFDVQIIPAYGHSAKVINGESATCTTDGVTSYSYCERCGVHFSEPAVIKATGHKVVVDNAVVATCTSTGLTAGSHCSVCNKVLTTQVTTAKSDHVIVKDNAISPTCTTAGKTEGSHCSKCGKVIVAQKSVAATGHNIKDGKTVQPTCTQYGYTEAGVCTICGAVLKDRVVLKPLGHDYDHQGKVEATCTEDGHSAYTICKVCGYESSTKVIIPATGHKYVNDKCTVCGMYKDYGFEFKCLGKIYGDRDVLGYELVGCGTNTDSIVYIPVRTPDGGYVNRIAEYAFYCNENVTEIRFPELPDGEGVYYIGYGAFADCPNLKSVNLPSSIWSLPDYAFSNCPNLTSVTGVNITHIGAFCFNRCYSLKYLKIESWYDFSAGEWAFKDCSDVQLFFEHSEATKMLTKDWDYWDPDQCVTIMWSTHGGPIGIRTFGSDGLAYYSFGDGTCAVIGLGTCMDEEVYIPAYNPQTGDIVVEIGQLTYGSTVGTDYPAKVVHIPHTVKKIDDYAFHDGVGAGTLGVIYDGTVEEFSHFQFNSYYQVMGYSCTEHVCYVTCKDGCAPIVASSTVFQLNPDGKSYSVIGYNHPIGGSTKTFTIVVPELYMGLPVTQVKRYLTQLDYPYHTTNCIQLVNLANAKIVD